MNNKIYIGQTTRDIESRWSQHKYLAKNSHNHRSNKPLYIDMRVYGIENFRIEVIEKCENEILREKEMYWIKYFNSFGEHGYNKNIGGDGLHYYDEKEIYKMWDEGCTFKEILSKYGMDKSCLRKILNKYEPFLEQRKDRYFESRSRIKHKSRPVNQYALDGTFIRTFDSVKEAAREIKKSPMGIVKACKGITKSGISNGFRWKYVYENQTNVPTINKKVPVFQYDINGNYIEKYDSLADTARKTGVNQSGLCQAIKKGVVYKGYFWKTTKEAVS